MAQDQASGQAAGDQESQGARVDNQAAADDIAQLPEWAQAVIRKTREEAAASRVKARELEEYRNRVEAEKLTETERLKRDADAAREAAQQAAAELRTERGAIALQRAALAVGVDPDLAQRLVTIEFDDAGQPRNVEAALRGLVTKYPQLAAADAGSSGSNPNRPRGGAGTFTETQIADRRFYEANRDAILQAYQEGRIVKG